MPNKLQLNNNICESTAQEHKILQVILYSKTGLKRSFRDFCYTKNKSGSKIYIIFFICYNLLWSYYNNIIKPQTSYINISRF